MKKIIIVLTILLILTIGFYFGQSYSFISYNSTTKDVVTKEVLPNNFISCDQVEKMKVGDKFFNPLKTTQGSDFIYVVSQISEPKSFSDGSSGSYKTFIRNPDYYAVSSVHGRVEYTGEETDQYFLDLDSVSDNLPVPYSKGELGYSFFYPTSILLNHDSGKFLYEYWNSKGANTGEVYITDFDMLGCTVTNLKVNPVSIN